MTPEWSPEVEAFFATVQMMLEIAAPLLVALVVVLVVRRILRAS